MTRLRPKLGRLCRGLGYLAAGLLLIAPLAQAETDQLQKALTQTEASLRSLGQGDTQGAAAHAEAAKTHLDIAAREARGQTLQDLKACATRLKEAEQLARKVQTAKAQAAAEKARDSLKQWVQVDQNQ